MSKDAQCTDEPCTACGAIVARTYRELRQGGYGDKAAFVSALKVLELRYPGHDKAYYRSRTAEWIDAEWEC